jgi:hypothetical protein
MTNHQNHVEGQPEVGPETDILAICQRPSMYVNPARVDTILAFISGYDLARDGGPLNGLREWLVVRRDGGNNLHWTGLALDVLGATGGIDALDKEEHERLTRQLGELLDEFFSARREYSVTKMHFDYARWLRRKRWYDGPLRG